MAICVTMLNHSSHPSFPSSVTPVPFSSSPLPYLPFPRKRESSRQSRDSSLALRATKAVARRMSVRGQPFDFAQDRPVEPRTDRLTILRTRWAVIHSGLPLPAS